MSKFNVICGVSHTISTLRTPSTYTIAVSQTPQLSECLANIYAVPSGATRESVVATGYCTADTTSSPAVWLSATQPTRVEVVWRADFVNPPTLPVANFVSDKQLGVAASRYAVSVNSAPGSC